jgi:hypothetical protein
MGRSSGAEVTGTLGRRSRTWRLVLTALVLALVAAGSLVGTDEWFPFGPFRMYARATSPDATVSVLSLEAVTADGDVIPLNADRVLGLRRAELEGQAPLVRENPELLGVLVREYRRVSPEIPEIVEVRLVATRVEMKDGRAVGEPSETVQAVWVAP